MLDDVRRAVYVVYNDGVRCTLSTRFSPSITEGAAEHGHGRRGQAGTAQSPDPRPGPSRRDRQRRRGRARGPDDADARRDARGRADGAVPPRGQQGRPDRRDGRRRLQRDRRAVRLRRLEDVHAAAGDRDPRRAVTPPVGRRIDGVTATSGPGQPAPPRCGDRQAPGGGVRRRDGRPRVLGPGQLHLRIRADEDEPAVRDRGGGRSGVGDHAPAVPGQRVPQPRRVPQRARRCSPATTTGTSSSTAWS